MKTTVSIYKRNTYINSNLQKLTRQIYLLSVDIIAGGRDIGNYGNKWKGNRNIYYDTILEYDINGDSIRKIGKMRDVYYNFAISVVQSADFSQSGGCATDNNAPCIDTPVASSSIHTHLNSCPCLFSSSLNYLKMCRDLKDESMSLHIKSSKILIHLFLDKFSQQILI